MPLGLVSSSRPQAHSVGIAPAACVAITTFIDLRAPGLRLSRGIARRRSPQRGPSHRIRRAPGARAPGRRGPRFPPRRARCVHQRPQSLSRSPRALGALRGDTRRAGDSRGGLLGPGEPPGPSARVGIEGLPRRCARRCPRHQGRPGGRRNGHAPRAFARRPTRRRGAAPAPCKRTPRRTDRERRARSPPPPAEQRGRHDGAPATSSPRVLLQGGEERVRNCGGDRLGRARAALHDRRDAGPARRSWRGACGAGSPPSP